MPINHAGRINRLGFQKYANRENSDAWLDDRVFDGLNDGDEFAPSFSYGCLDALDDMPAGSMVSYQPGGFDYSVVDREVDASSLNIAYDLGYMARTYKACPFIPGAAMREAWDLAMVEKAVDLGTITPDMPLDVLGRIAFLKGEKMPAALAVLPRADANRIAWHAGYLKQQDITNNTGFADTIPGYAWLYARTSEISMDDETADAPRA